MINNKQTAILSLLLLLLFSLLGFYWTKTDKLSPNFGQGTILSRFNNELAASYPEVTPVETSALILLSNSSVVSAVSSADKEAVEYYEKGTGKKYELNLETHRKTEIPDKKPKLGKDVRGFAFSPDGSRLAIFQNQGDANVILIADPDGSTPKDLLTTRLETIKLIWPQDNTLVFQAQNPDGGEDIFSLSLNRALTKILSNPGPAMLNWASRKNKFLFSIKDGGRNQLSIWSNGVTYKTDINTPASLCAWSLSGNTAVCAVQNNSQAGLSDLIQLEAGTNTSKTIKEGLDIRPKEVLLSHLEKYLVIVDNQNQLYAIRVNI